MSIGGTTNNEDRSGSASEAPRVLWTRGRLFLVFLFAMSPLLFLWGWYLAVTPSQHRIQTLEPIPGVKVILYRRHEFGEPYTELWYQIIVDGKPISERQYVCALWIKEDLHFQSIAVEDRKLIGVYETSHPHRIILYYDAKTGRYYPGRINNNVDPSTMLGILQGVEWRFRKATGDAEYEVTGQVDESD